MEYIIGVDSIYTVTPVTSPETITVDYAGRPETSDSVHTFPDRFSSMHDSANLEPPRGGFDYSSKHQPGEILFSSWLSPLP